MTAFTYDNPIVTKNTRVLHTKKKKQKSYKISIEISKRQNIITLFFSFFSIFASTTTFDFHTEKETASESDRADNQQRDGENPTGVRIPTSYTLKYSFGFRRRHHRFADQHDDDFFFVVAYSVGAEINPKERKKVKMRLQHTRAVIQQSKNTARQSSV